MVNKAMILAAGFGTRLKPITNNIPKALVPFRGETIISYQIKKLISLGIEEIVINTHHFSGLMEKYFSENDFGVKVNLLTEKVILGTGGGIMNAFEYLSDEHAFFVVNVDAFTNLNFPDMLSEFEKSKPVALLAVQKRKTSRYLEFEDGLILSGRVKSDIMEDNFYAFNGIHLISNKIFQFNYKSDYKDIIDIYLEMVKDNSIVKGYDSGNSYFIDLGKIENIMKAESLCD